MFASLEKITRHFGVFCVALLFFLMVVQVIFRYGFNYTHFVTEELARYLIVWLTLAGMAIESRSGGHIRVAFIVQHFPENLRRCWQFTIEIIIFLLFLLLVYTGIDSTLFNHGQESSGMQLPLSIPFVAIPVFFAIAAIFSWERLRKLGEKKS